MNDIAIKAEDIAFSYDKRTVLKAVNFCIPRGEIWALVGRSGVGKTTLLQIVAGLFKPSQGQIQIERGGAFVVEGIRGIVFQDDALLGWLTVLENILFPHHRRPSAELKKVASDMLRSVGIGLREESLPRELSAGMRKRLEFARALVADKEFILADEPFGTVDALTRRELWRLWERMREEQPRTGLLCTHDPEEAVRLCDAVIILEQGEPANAAPPLRVPSEIRSIPIEHEDPRISGLKEEILARLNGGSHEAT